MTNQVITVLLLVELIQTESFVKCVAWMDIPMVVFVMKITAVIQLLQSGKKVLCYQLDIEKLSLTF